jgi:hypothetical protein
MNMNGAEVDREAALDRGDGRSSVCGVPKERRDEGRRDEREVAGKEKKKKGKKERTNERAKERNSKSLAEWLQSRRRGERWEAHGAEWRGQESGSGRFYSRSPYIRTTEW